MGAPYDSEGSHVDVSEECSRALGEAVGLDWGEFGAQPEAFSEPDDVTDWIVAGLFVMASADLGSVGELEADLLDDEIIAVELREHRKRWRLDDEDPAGVLWVAYATERLDTLRPNERTDQDYIMAMYYPGMVDVYYALPDVERGRLNHPAIAAGILLHEAAHSTAQNHLGVSPFLYDEDVAGAFGVEARWLHGWSKRYTDDSEMIAENWYERCQAVLDRSRFSACSE